RRAAVLLDGIREWGESVGEVASERRETGSGRVGATGGTAGAGGVGGASCAGVASRSEAGECVAGRGRQSEDQRLRTGEVTGSRRRADGERDRAGDAGGYGAGASSGADGDDRA